jgi:hypothetical protein
VSQGQALQFCGRLEQGRSACGLVGTARAIASPNNMHELRILAAEAHFVIELEAGMKIKKCGLQSEAARLFGLNNSLERLQTKNVIEASILVPPLPFGQQKRERVSRSRS